MIQLTQERLRELLCYDQITGVFFWEIGRAAGAVAGWGHPSGYIFIKLDGRSYAAHRLAWLYVHGRWPVDQTDHRNGKRNDNRIQNLRECSSAENNQNTAIYGSNRSGLLGVGWHKASRRWRARIDAGGKQNHLGLFSSPEEAHEAYLSAKARLHTFQPAPRPY